MVSVALFVDLFFFMQFIDSLYVLITMIHNFFVLFNSLGDMTQGRLFSLQRVRAPICTISLFILSVIILNVDVLSCGGALSL